MTIPDPSVSQSGVSVQALPLPKRDQPQRARVILDFYENGDHIHEAEEGWAMIEGSWLLWLADADSGGQGWQSWPMRHVLCVEWLLDA